MEYINDTPIIRKNKHLSQFERGKIQLLLAEGLSPYAISKKLGRASNTIRNEIRRGTVPQVKGSKTVCEYFPDTGQLVYEKNRKRSVKKYKLLSCMDFITYAEDLILNQNQSVDSVCGAASRFKVFQPQDMVCSKTLYNYIDLGFVRISNMDLPSKLTRRTKSSRIRKHKRILGNSIINRPAHIDLRMEFGHWEIDTVVCKKSKHEPALLTMTERKTRMEIIRRIPNRSAKSVFLTLDKMARDIGCDFNKVFKSFTADNGSEFAFLSNIAEAYKSEVYFAHPYSSYERGTNERHNGLIRRFIPKGKSILNYSDEAIKKIETWCNQLPRKILDYHTPTACFQEELRLLLNQ